MVSLSSSREVEQGCRVSFVNYLYLVTLIIGQIFCATCATLMQSGPETLVAIGKMGGIIVAAATADRILNRKPHTVMARSLSFLTQRQAAFGETGGGACHCRAVIVPI